MPKKDSITKEKSNKNNMSAQLAKVIANSDTDSLKQMILEKLGVETQEQLINRVLDVLDTDEEEKAVQQQYTQNDEPLALSLSRLLEDDEPQDYAEEDSSEDEFDIASLLFENKDLFVQMMYDKLIGSQMVDDPRVNLLYALRPFLNSKRQSKVESAVKFMGVAEFMKTQFNPKKES